mgnify:FL=1
MKPRFADESYGDQNREAQLGQLLALSQIDISWQKRRGTREVALTGARNAIAAQFRSAGEKTQRFGPQQRQSAA